ncbi:MAG: hypothetical protein FWD21_00490, partial [Peptococcaceae bacterium]|nr:hypothetical protein [Peptococcaceae bacterium]
MNVGFRADGSSETGMGHIMRCAALANYFDKQGDSVCFYCDSARKEGADWLEIHGYSVVCLCERDLRTEAQTLVKELKNNLTDIL